MVGGDQLVQVLNDYPCLHDADIEGITLDRSDTGIGFDAGIKLIFNRWDMEESGNTVLVDRTQFWMRFRGFRFGHFRADFFPEQLLLIKALIPSEPSNAETPWEVEVVFAISGSTSLDYESVEITDIIRLE